MKARFRCVLFTIAALCGSAIQPTLVAAGPNVTPVVRPKTVPAQVHVYLADTGRTVPLGLGQTLVVTVPLKRYHEDTWSVYRNSPAGLQLVAGPNTIPMRNPTPLNDQMQVFSFKRVSTGTINLGLEEHYFNKPLVLTIADGPPYVPPPPPPPPRPAKHIIQRLVLRGIYFDFDRYNIRPGDAAVLDEDISALNANPKATIEVNGYCDSIGGEKYNLKLSELRADAVVDYLVKAGIASDRLVPHGYGKTGFVATNETEEGRAQNRRVELVPTE